MTVHYLPAAARSPQPWKNGLGTTTEILVWPTGSTASTFDWRASIADMIIDAPFSALPGIDRTLVALGGDGLRLTIDGKRIELAEFESVSFAGEVEVSGAPRARPTRDLNLMVRRGAITGEVTVVSGEQTHRVETSEAVRKLAVLVAGTGAVIENASDTTRAQISLNIGDGVLVDGGDHPVIVLCGVLIVATLSG